MPRPRSNKKVLEDLRKLLQDVKDKRDHLTELANALERTAQYIEREEGLGFWEETNSEQGSGLDVDATKPDPFLSVGCPPEDRCKAVEETRDNHFDQCQLKAYHDGPCVFARCMIRRGMSQTYSDRCVRSSSQEHDEHWFDIDGRTLVHKQCTFRPIYSTNRCALVFGHHGDHVPLP